ncbi:hypothetical protein [Cellulomonas telluris]|uniref:hypothetical protein n=1 Tax=Cellulomonas telluris TaxID=2306636 RepID=UPI0010A81619|nr:hypothetical protein [Cellulomonas telluris]
MTSAADPGDVAALGAALVNRAVVAYVGRGSGTRPTVRPDVLAPIAPAGRADDLRALVERLLAEAEEIDVPAADAVARSLVPAFAERIRVRHPWLDDTAVDALCWASRYRRLYE